MKILCKLGFHKWVYPSRINLIIAWMPPWFPLSAMGIILVSGIFGLVMLIRLNFTKKR
jgi:hypothetical protein